MTETLLLGRRAVREVVRCPEATIPTLFIPLLLSEHYAAADVAGEWARLARHVDARRVPGDHDS